MDFAVYGFVAVLAYLLGSIPTGYLVARAKGVDIRSVGSGNIGATNVLRTLGKNAGMFVLAADGVKGFLACALTTFAAPGSGLPDATALERLRIVAGIAAILGHNYTCWLRFKGGKGIATTAGVMVAWAPTALLATLGVWGLSFALSRYVSLASIAAALFLPLATWLTGRSFTVVALTVGLSALALLKHRTNLQRLLAGTEHRFHFGKAPGRPPP